MITSDSFFERPRSWSLIKYKILKNYLLEYFPKVNQKYRSPAIVADLFAGKGKFDDGSDGSPMIIANLARIYRQKLGFNNRVVLAEINDEDREQLKNNLHEFIDQGIVNVIPGEAADVGLFLLKNLPQQIPLFMFLDPFGIKGLSMRLLLQVFQRAKKGSTELLINFNHRAIPRLTGICKNLHSKNDTLRKQAETITSIVTDSLGGNWWLDIMNSESIPDDDKPQIIQSKYLESFREIFQWLGVLPVTTGLKGEEVKYFLIFASQSQIAIEIMNDVMIKAKRELMLEEIRCKNVDTLFENNEPSEFLYSGMQPDIEALPQLMLQEAFRIANERCKSEDNPYSIQMKRPELRKRFIESQFARFTKSEYNEAIKKLLETGDLITENGSVRISDEKFVKLVKR